MKVTRQPVTCQPAPGGLTAADQQVTAAIAIAAGLSVGRARHFQRMRPTAARPGP